jgi:hypothetical protein
MKKESHHKPKTMTRRENYMWGLAKSVGEACEVWLEGRGLKSLGWKQQKSIQKKQKKGSSK